MAIKKRKPTNPASRFQEYAGFEELTTAGNLGQMLRDVDAVGSDLLWLGRVASPSLRIARMTIAGE